MSYLAALRDPKTLIVIHNSLDIWSYKKIVRKEHLLFDRSAELTAEAST